MAATQPRTNKAVAKTAAKQAATTGAPVKRGRGRPPKNPALSAAPRTARITTSQVAEEVRPKRAYKRRSIGEPLESASSGSVGRVLQSLSWITVAYGAVLVVLLAGVIFFGLEYKHEKNQVDKLVAAQKAAPKSEAEELTKEVSALVAIPDEAPTLATVTDPSKLQDQPFFKDAQTGDKVLIFTNAKRAILYRPSTHKVIESAPVNLNGSAANAGAQSTTQNTASGLGQ